jgi:hypothetical protein
MNGRNAGGKQMGENKGGTTDNEKARKIKIKERGNK